MSRSRRGERNGRRRRARQVLLPFARRGGRRKGAGRKRRSTRPRVSHKARAALASRLPVLVTVRIRQGLVSLRRKEELTCLRRAFALGSQRFGFRLIHFSVQSNHLHMLAEAHDARALSRGMQGLLVRVARGLNRLWRRSGSLIDDHYHARILRSPREVRHALVYVLHNAKKHGAAVVGIDPFSSGPWFDGWSTKRPSDRVQSPAPPSSSSPPSPLAHARTWLLAIGWRRHGLIGIDEQPRLVDLR